MLPKKIQNCVHLRHLRYDKYETDFYFNKRSETFFAQVPPDKKIEAKSPSLAVAVPPLEGDLVTTRVTLKCLKCSYRAKRDLLLESGNRGVKETGSEPARCPNGHGALVRADGLQQEKWAGYGFRLRKWPDR